jgi:leucyl-tRNA synthetase
VVTPDEVVDRYGADILRLHLLFMAPFDRNVTWDEEGIHGAERFLQRVWRLCLAKGRNGKEARGEENALRRAMHKTIRRVTDDVEAFKFNTALAALMEFSNALAEHLDRHGLTPAYTEAAEVLIRLLAPFAPHIAEELWARRDGPYSIHQQSWPTYDPDLAADEMRTLIIQVNGKVRDRIAVPAGIEDQRARSLALASPQIQRYLDNGQPQRVIVVPGRLVNIVIG